jgi:hypothetical protein
MGGKCGFRWRNILCFLHSQPNQIEAPRTIPVLPQVAICTASVRMRSWLRALSRRHLRRVTLFGQKMANVGG